MNCDTSELEVTQRYSADSEVKNREKQEILTFHSPQQTNVWDFSLTNALNYYPVVDGHIP